MISLDKHRIIVAAEDVEGLATERADLLACAGASVDVCSPATDLWVRLADGRCDVLLLIAKGGEGGFRPFAPLRVDPRIRMIPCLCLLDASAPPSPADLSAISPCWLLPVDSSVEEFLEKTAQAASFCRSHRATEEKVRELEEAVRYEEGRAERAVHDAADLSHDLRSILNVAYGFSCNLRDELAGPLTDDQRDHVQRILSAVDSAGALLTTARKSHMSWFARDSNTPQPPRSAKAQRMLVCVPSLAQEVIGMLEPSAEAKGIRLGGSFEEDVCVWGDSLKLKQVLLNLIGNAIKFTPARGQVDVEVRWSSSGGAPERGARRLAEISVSDTGPGIAPEWRKRIFERGVRIDGHSQIPGKGIGLYIVREIVLRHGGSIHVQATVPGGARFVVLLPADLRQSTQPTLLVLREGRAAQALVDLLVSLDRGGGGAWSPERTAEFAELARGCQAILVAPTANEGMLREWLARAASLAESEPEGADLEP